MIEPCGRHIAKKAHCIHCSTLFHTLARQCSTGGYSVYSVVFPDIVCHADRWEVNTTNTRIKKLRKALDLTQQAFADRLGIRQNTVAKYETGRGEPTRAVIALICREFHVSEAWLRTGEGEMFLPAPRDALDELIAEYGLPSEVRAMTEKFLALSPNDQQAVIRYVREVSAAIAAQFAPPPWEAEKPVPPGYSSRAELEAEADEFAAMAREQFRSEKIPGYQASFASDSDGPGVA